VIRKYLSGAWSTNLQVTYSISLYCTRGSRSWICHDHSVVLWLDQDIGSNLCLSTIIHNSEQQRQNFHHVGRFPRGSLSTSNIQFHYVLYNTVATVRQRRFLPPFPISTVYSMIPFQSAKIWCPDVLVVCFQFLQTHSNHRRGETLSSFIKNFEVVSIVQVR
jgi:hypothetical protein